VLLVLLLVAGLFDADLVDAGLVDVVLTDPGLVGSLLGCWTLAWTFVLGDPGLVDPSLVCADSSIFPFVCLYSEITPQTIRNSCPDPP